MSGSTALSTFVAAAVAYVYEAIDPDTKLPFYVGRTGDMDRRAREHQKRCMKKIRELMKLKNFRFPDVQRRVPELPNGCAEDDAQRMEAYFIFERNTVYHPETCPHGCNSRIGDHGTELSPDDFTELKKMFDGEGYTFPVQEPEIIRDARAECAIAGEFVAMAKEVEDDESVQVFQECHVLAKRALLDAERTHLSLRAFVERVLTDYEGKYIDAVDQEALQVALNAIKEKMSEEERFADLTRIVTSMSLVCKEKEGVDVSSEAAASGLKMVLAMLATREEATLVWKSHTVKERIMEVRTWTRSHGLKKPLHLCADRHERALGTFLATWKDKSANYGGKCTDLEQCRLVMRDIGWFDEFLHSKEKKASEWVELNKQLLAGCAWHAEPDFEGKVTISSNKDNKSVYWKLSSLLKGIGKPDDVDQVLKGLPPSRASYYRESYAANRSHYLELAKRGGAAQRKRIYQERDEMDALKRLKCNDDALIGSASTDTPVKKESEEEDEDDGPIG